ncbi:MAG: T9SS type A sorting domain-containing protein [Bacteroidia bacterium]|nr:T9SS type A sorting domain-containing protein [Bacteroidia bacterium]
MKNLYLTTLALASAFTVSAQVTLTKAANEPVIGDINKLTYYDSVSVVPKSIGTNQIWNFSGMTAQGSNTVNYVNPSSVSGASLFPTTTIAENEIGSTRYEFYRSAGSNYEFVGQLDAVQSETLVFSNSGILRSYPISYGSVSTDGFVALQTSGSNTMSFSGTATISANGTGTVILPNGNVHPNCLQVTESITLTVVSGTVNMTGYFRNVYYYETGRKFPIFEYDYEVMGSLKFTARADSDALLAGVNEVATISPAATIYPNPTKSDLFINLSGQETPQSLQVMDMAGRNVMDQEFSNSINVESLEQGLYILKLNYKEKTAYQRFVKTN